MDEATKAALRALPDWVIAGYYGRWLMDLPSRNYHGFRAAGITEGQFALHFLTLPAREWRNQSADGWVTDGQVAAIRAALEATP